jgi:hypothetical protein
MENTTETLKTPLWTKCLDPNVKPALIANQTTIATSSISASQVLPEKVLMFPMDNAKEEREANAPQEATATSSDSALLERWKLADATPAQIVRPITTATSSVSVFQALPSRQLKF